MEEFYMKITCLECGKLTNKRVYNGEYYCDDHLKNGLADRNNIKKSKRVYIDDDVYYQLVKKAADLHMDLRTYLSRLLLKTTA